MKCSQHRCPAIQKLGSTYIAAQLDVGPKLIKEYSTTRDTTRREHLAQVQREFGFTSFTAQVRDELAQSLLPIALRG